jgi:pimeloyl-ACP methyl ester carboxylesterase
MKRLTTALITGLTSVAVLGGCTSSSPSTPSKTAAASTPSASSATQTVSPSTGEGANPVGLTAAPSNTPAGKISWASCGDEKLPGLQCATLKLPIDPKKPTGEMFDMALSKLPATGKKATGSIVVNPGGPGGSGLGYALSVSRSMSDAVKEKYDIIGFDPRGVGKSLPIDCVDDAWLDKYALTDPTPDTPEEKAINKAGDLEAACSAKYPNGGVYSTINVTADLESLRIALGHDKLDFYGASYGSYLGGVFATLYPTKVGHFVLDAAFVPEKDGATSTLIQQKGFNKAFGNWVTWCNKNTKCAFHSDDTLARWNKLVDQMEAKPLMVGTREAGEGTISAATYASMYSPTEWSILAKALANAEKGNASGLVSIFDNFYGRDPSGKWDNLPEANNVINCASGLSPSVTTGVEQLVKDLKAAGPLGRFTTPDGFDSPCTTPVVIPSYAGSQTIVVVGAQNDPATPYSQSLVLTKDMGPKAKLITFTGEGHGGVSASQCSADAVSAYFEKDTPPKDGLTCGPTPKASSPVLSALKVPKTFTESSFEDAGAVLGLDTAKFATKTFAVDNKTGKATIAELEAEVKKQGFKIDANEAIPSVEDTFNVLLTNDAGDRIIAIVFGSKAFGAKDLQSLKVLVDDGQSMVILATPVS